MISHLKSGWGGGCITEHDVTSLTCPRETPPHGCGHFDWYTSPVWAKPHLLSTAQGSSTSRVGPDGMGKESFVCVCVCGPILFIRLVNDEEEEEVYKSEASGLECSSVYFQGIMQHRELCHWRGFHWTRADSHPHVWHWSVRWGDRCVHCLSFGENFLLDCSTNGCLLSPFWPCNKMVGRSWKNPKAKHSKNWLYITLVTCKKCLNMTCDNDPVPRCCLPGQSFIDLVSLLRTSVSAVWLCILWKQSLSQRP